MTERTGTQVKKQVAGRRAASRTLHCLVSGFDSFGNFDFNPSQWVAQSLPAKVSIPGDVRNLEIKSLVIPTCCDASWKAIQRHLARRDYELLLMAGLANSYERISLERFALNIRDYSMADNSGHLFQGERIDEDGPDALRTELPLKDLQQHLQNKGFPTDISNFAGAFICNEVFYRGLRYQQRHPKLRAVLFVHLPDASSYAETLAKAGISAITKLKSASAKKKRALEIMSAAIIEIAQFCARRI